jgi:hypothetical protein
MTDPRDAGPAAWLLGVGGATLLVIVIVLVMGALLLLTGEASHGTTQRNDRRAGFPRHAAWP